MGNCEYKVGWPPSKLEQNMTILNKSQKKKIYQESVIDKSLRLNWVIYVLVYKLAFCYIQKTKFSTFWVD